MYHYLYKITNNVNGRIYIGVHSTKNLFDGYMGSGTNIIRAIKKHGIEKFTKKILYRFADRETLMICESVVVDNEFVLRDNTYNIRCGGAFGPFGCTANDETRRMMSESMSGRVPPNKGVKMSDIQRAKLRLAWKTRAPASAETNKKISDSLKEGPDLLMLGPRLAQNKKEFLR